jgi:hypothetical protein
MARLTQDVVLHMPMNIVRLYILAFLSYIDWNTLQAI